MNDYSQGNKRKISLDIAKGIAILSVMMVHFPREYRLFLLGIISCCDFLLCYGNFSLKKVCGVKKKFLKKRNKKGFEKVNLSVYCPFFDIYNCIFDKDGSVGRSKWGSTIY